MASYSVSLIGQKFHRLTVIGLSARKRYVAVRCECGKEKEVYLTNMTSGRSRSCGCLCSEINAVIGANNARTHGKTHTPEHKIWLGMISRCHTPTGGSYENYGARGITVCDRWRGENGFVNFLADMGERPSPGHSIDRIDNASGYSPENCKWSTRSEQARNRRSSRLETLDGKTQPLIAWCEEYGISATDLHNRLRQGWDLRRALTEPVKRKRR